MLYASSNVPTMELIPDARLSNRGLILASYTSLALPTVSSTICLMDARLSATTPRRPSIVVLNASWLSMNGLVMRSSTSLPSLAEISYTPIAAFINMPSILAVTCWPFSPPNTEKILAAAWAKFPYMVAYSDPISNILTMKPFMRSLFSARHISMPPRMFVPIVMPTLAAAPVHCPRAYTNVLVKLLAALSTSESVKISLRLSLIPLTAFVMPLRSTSPRPDLKPSLNRACSSLSFSNNLSNTGLSESLSAAASTMLSVIVPPEAAPAVPDPLPESFPFERELISSKPARPP